MVNAELRVRETAQGLEVALHVVPRAKEQLQDALCLGVISLQSSSQLYLLLTLL